MGIVQEDSKAIVFEDDLANGNDVAAGRLSDQELSTAAVEEESFFDALPDSILVQHIFPLLSAPDKKALRLASPRARAQLNQGVTCVRASPAEELLTCPGIRLGERFPRLRAFHAEDTGDAPLTDDLIISFLADSVQSLQRLQEVNVKQCHYVGRRLLAFLRGNCPALVRLSASRWTDNGMLYEVARCEGLQELDLGDSDIDVLTIDDVGLNALDALPHLTSLSLARCRYMGDAAALTLGRLPSLRWLDLSHTDIGPRGVAWLAQLPALHTLSLSDCRRIDDDALALVTALTALATLALRNTEVSNSGLRHLRTLRLLRSLSLGSRFELDDEGLSALAGCASLRQLSAGSFNLKRLLPRGGFPALEHLSFGGGFANKGLQLLFPLPALKSLHVQGIDAVTDSVMKTVSSQTSLERLALRSGYSLTEDGLQTLSGLGNLAVLSVSACPAITQTCLGAFTNAHRRLSRLLVGVCPLLADAHDALVCDYVTALEAVASR